MAKKNITRKVKSNVNNNVYKAIDFSYLLGKVKGIDDKLMQIHFKLYEGFVAATNGALQFFNSKNASNMIQYSGVQREFSYFYNAMRLHELYFGVMCGENMDKILYILEQFQEMVLLFYVEIEIQVYYLILGSMILILVK